MLRILRHPIAEALAASRVYCDLPSLGLLLSRTFADDSSENTGDPPAAAEPVEQAATSDRANSQSKASTSQPGVPSRKKGKRPTRAEKGSWVDNPALTEEFLTHAPVWPANEPFYDVQGQAPWLTELASPMFESYKRMREEQPEFFEQMYSHPEEDAPPREGARKILEWEVNVVFESGPLTGEPHPLNKKVKCRVYLRDLQEECALTDEAVQHIALICGPRYDPAKGLLTITSERFREREENRLNVVDILHKLIAEGHAAYPQREAVEAAAAGSG